ncbi:LacI family DNA-binding transcriptional regulator [Micrococcoides hystricis]|uniref:LacI family DNA-binding transcriptional regulator n=1 Tax=Micrococcoides hystricis TaxID=1572761 RepID=A0ABV6PCG0_9MICC
MSVAKFGNAKLTQQKTVTLQDIANVAGVAVSTVSRAFTTPDRVNFQTMLRIHQVADELGYRRRPAPEVGGSSLHRTIDLMVQDIGNPFFTDLMKGAVQAAREADYMVLLGDAEESAAVELDHIHRILPSVDGLIASARWLTDSDLAEISRRKPLVLFNREVPGISSVCAETPEANRLLIQHLVSLGHRRIVYVSGPRVSWTNQQRWASVQEVTREHGIEPIQIGPFRPLLSQGAAAVDIAMSHDPTAIIAFNDQLAIGMLQAMSSKGIRVPEDVSIVSYDDTFGSSFSSPPLTCLRAEIEYAGREAVRLLLAQIRGSQEIHQLRIPSGLTVRASSSHARTSSASS